jgi:monoamine oxidase
VVLESEAEVGGRLSSDDNDPENTTNKDELGGMRIFPSHHKKVAELVTEVGCTLVPIPLGDADNIFFREGKHQRKAEVILDPSRGRSPGKMVEECIANYREQNPEDEEDAYESAELRSLSPRDFLLKYGASEMEVDAWVVFSGYDIFSDDEVSAAIFVKDGELYGAALSDEQKYVQQGYQEVVCRMVERASGEVSE